MNKAIKKEFFCTLDHGLFCELPRVIAPHVGKSGYWSTWHSAFPSRRQTRVGDFPGVIRIDDYYDVIDEVGTWIAIDTLLGGLEVDLERRGKPIWGARYAEDLENYRVSFRDLCKELGIPIPEYETVQGISKLKAYLQSHEDLWVKIDMFRGDMETWHHEDYRLSKPRIEKIAHDLIPFEEEQVFICEEPIPDSVEIAYDGYTVDGKFPSKSVFGIEVKSRSYFCHVMNYKDFPKEILDLNGKLAPVWEDFHCRSNVPIEIRVKKDGGYIALDPCQREGFPCFGAKLKLITNWPEIYYHGARGELVDPIFAEGCNCAMELVLTSDWARKEAQPVYFPSKYRDNVLLRYACEVDGICWVLPQLLPNLTAGSIAVVGRDYEDCESQILEIKDEIKGLGIEYDVASLDALKTEWEKLKGYGIELPSI